MAVTVISNTDTELSGKYVGEARLKTVTFSRTDAQIKALPSGVFEIKAAVANRLFIPQWAVIISNFTAGAYTNVHSGGVVSGAQPYLNVSVNDDNGNFLDYITNITAESITDFTDFFASATKKVMSLQSFHYNSAIAGFTRSFVQLQTALVGNIVLVCNNAGDGNFTGGNAANTLTGTVGYLEVVV